jgi:hypothetical protein
VACKVLITRSFTEIAMHPGRILGIIMGLVILVAVFLLPISGPDTLFGVVGPTLGNLGALQSTSVQLMVFSYLVIISFILLVIAGVVGFFPLGAGVLGIIGMAMLTVGPFIAGVDVAWNVAFYVLWIASIICLAASFWHRRGTQAQAAQSQVVNVNVPPPPPPAPAPQPPSSSQRSTIIVSPNISVKTGTTEEISKFPEPTPVEKAPEEKLPAPEPMPAAVAVAVEEVAEEKPPVEPAEPTEVEEEEELEKPETYTPEEAMEMYKMLKDRAESQANEKAKDALNKLKFKDVTGKAWKIDGQTNNWTYYDGKRWRKGTPPPVLETE